MARRKKEKSNASSMQISIFDYITEDDSKESISFDAGEEPTVNNEFGNEFDLGDVYSRFNNPSTRVQREVLERVEQRQPHNTRELEQSNRSNRPEVTKRKRSDVGLDNTPDSAVVNYKIQLTEEARLSSYFCLLVCFF
ncbi:MAG: hypothetical protein ACK5M0_06030, partial [Bacteroidales bacterium]